MWTLCKILDQVLGIGKARLYYLLLNDTTCFVKISFRKLLVLFVLSCLKQQLASENQHGTGNGECIVPNLILRCGGTCL